MEGRISEDQEQAWQEDAAAMNADGFGNTHTYADFASSSHQQRK